MSSLSYLDLFLRGKTLFIKTRLGVMSSTVKIRDPLYNNNNRWWLVERFKLEGENNNKELWLIRLLKGEFKFNKVILIELGKKLLKLHCRDTNSLRMKIKIKLLKNQMKIRKKIINLWILLIIALIIWYDLYYLFDKKL